ncbi:hypothetical protein Ddc_03862 [Ditylenchus destructor]|nr:hypothetical protein Ddc_03862 [Ditylenchus destructor]
MLDIKEQFAFEEDKSARKLLAEETDESSTATTSLSQSTETTLSPSSASALSSTSDKDTSPELNKTQSTESEMASESTSSEVSTFKETTSDDISTSLGIDDEVFHDVFQYLVNGSITDPDGWNEPPWGAESFMSYENNWEFVKQLRQNSPECSEDKCGRVCRFKMFSRLTGVCCERKDRGVWQGARCRDARSDLPWTTWTSSDCETMYSAANNDSHTLCSDAKCDEQRKVDCQSVTLSAEDEKNMEQCQWYNDNCKSKGTQDDCNKRRNDCYTVLKMTADQWYKCYHYAVDPCINAISEGPKNCSWRKTIFYKDDLRITTCDKDPAQYNCAHEWLKAYVCKGPNLLSHPDYDESTIELTLCNETSTESAAGIPLISWIWWTLFFSLFASISLQC